MKRLGYLLLTIVCFSLILCSRTSLYTNKASSLIEQQEFLPNTIPGGNYVNGRSINTPYGPGYHVDTIGSDEYDYAFFGYSSTYYYSSISGSILIYGYYQINRATLSSRSDGYHAIWRGPKHRTSVWCNMSVKFTLRIPCHRCQAVGLAPVARDSARSVYLSAIPD